MITSVQNETIKNIMKLKQKKYRDQEGLFLVEGYHLVEEAIKNHCVKTIISTQQYQDYETVLVSDTLMKKLAFTKTPQPIMAVCYKKEEEIVQDQVSRYLLLDRIQDPGNLGTMMRTALALGFTQIILSLDCVDLYNDKVVRASQGAIFQMKTCTMDLQDAISFLKSQEVQIVGTSLKNASPINQIQSTNKMAFVMGNEGQGVSQDVLNACDQLLYIPITHIESLNVAIASAIIMYHFKNEY